MILDKIEVVTDYKHLQIREITESGKNHRRVLHCDMDVSNETQTIRRGSDENGDPIMKTVKEIAEELWTDEVKSSWATHLAEREALQPPKE